MVSLTPPPLRREVDMTNREEVKKIVKSSIGTKFIKKWYATLSLAILACHYLPLSLFLSLSFSFCLLLQVRLGM